MKNNESELIDLLSEVLKETIKLQREINRIRTKMESDLFKIGTKYRVIDNSILVCKNKYRNSVKSYTPLRQNVPSVMDFN
jgi:predicted RNase H-like nuclease (RuvC/YqgF family)